ncbi:helix-turn-helix domain-containing protein [Nocardioides carbamazepini]|uniref:arsenate reductase/protein-tyrosine-phosphatase family protein n=1 Tax=Nocardioides carbamazepini TaxID=2854259 RepID=UPI00214A1AB7|nr:helix-turn-helix domain-containing protein [Nocardioides carbamazepini]MCR1785532.1 helix-turn-helix domain-containing protein [Nocardioides carbamazepini]
MNAEQMAKVGRRVEVYAALADPTRLQVVDLLTVGDAASSELSTRLGTPSNLLAHHLGILELAGVIERHRSEGDRRRSYWRLLPDAVASLSGPPLAMPGRVVFVCTANTARSQLAAALWRRASAIPVASAGTHPADRIAPGARATARRHRLDLPDVTPRHLGDLDHAPRGDDLLVTVCDRAHEELGSVAPVHWSVPDPVTAGTKAAFDRAHDELATRVHRLVPLLRPAS